MGACLCVHRGKQQQEGYCSDFARLGDGLGDSSSSQRSPAGVCIGSALAVPVPVRPTVLRPAPLRLPDGGDDGRRHAPALSLDGASVLRPALSKSAFCPSACAQPERGGPFEAQPVKEGWLLKRSQRGVWHRRWFRTHNAYLHYFKNKAEADVATGDGLAEKIGAAIDLRLVVAIDIVCDGNGGGGGGGGGGAPRLPFSPMGTVLRLQFKQPARRGSILAMGGGDGQQQEQQEQEQGRSCITLKAPTPASALAWKMALDGRQVAALQQQQQQKQKQKQKQKQGGSKPAAASPRVPLAESGNTRHQQPHLLQPLRSPLAVGDCRAISFNTPPVAAAPAVK